MSVAGAPETSMWCVGTVQWQEWGRGTWHGVQSLWVLVWCSGVAACHMAQQVEDTWHSAQLMEHMAHAEGHVACAVCG